MEMIKPSELNENLSEENINEIGAIIYKARAECLDNFIEGRDNNWSGGTRAWQWSRQAIVDASDNLPFLKIIKNKGLSFLFAINDVPVLFYRGDVEKLKSNIVNFKAMEQKQYSLFSFSGDDNLHNIIWRFVIETDFFQEVSKIYFLGINNNTKQIKCLYELPMQNQNVALITGLTTRSAEDKRQLEEISISYKNEDYKVANN